MFALFLALAILSLLALIGGTGLALAKYGQTRRSGPEIGAEMMRSRMETDAGREDEQVLADGAVFIGKGVGVEGEVLVTIPELKQAWRAGQKRAVMPFIIAFAGFEGMLVFGALALLNKLSDRIAGLILLAMAAYLLWMIIGDLRKAD